MWFANKYKCVFFDLDRTLWDFESNANETLKELYVKYNLDTFISSPCDFIKTYSTINNRLWAEYISGNLRKEQLRQLRFYLTLKQYGRDDRNMGIQIDTDYIAICPQKTVLFPYAQEILHYLSSKKYKLYIITNGFSEIQDIKLRKSGISHFFSAVFSSEDVGYSKPDPRIFQYALSVAKVPAKKCIMIGDDWKSDICGAKKAGMSQIFFNPLKKEQKIGNTTYEISHLKEIEDIL